MKLATLDDGTRGGSLLVVSRDLKRAVPAREIAPTLQAAIENWGACESALRELASAPHARTPSGASELVPGALAAPLPRAYQWLDASAFHSHGDLMEKVFRIDP